MLAAFMNRLVTWCSRKAWMVLLFFVLLVGASALSTMHFLNVSTDTDEMFSDQLAWKQRNAEISRLFPQNDGLMVVVISSDIPEQGRATARALAQKLRKEPKIFKSVQLPDDNSFLQSHGLLYLDQKTLGGLLDSLIAAQPFIGTLAADPSARGLFDALGLIGEGLSSGQEIPTAFTPELNAFATALNQAAEGQPQDLSWQNLLAGSLGDLSGKYVFVLARPVLDFGSLEPGGRAYHEIRKCAATLPFVASGKARVMVTGSVQLSDEEFSTVAHGMGIGLITSLVLVTCWLMFAVRSPRVIVPILITLLSGLALTTGFAALAVGKLNLISIAFAILFVGIAVDFAIQFCVRFRAQGGGEKTAQPLPQALAKTGEETGHQILVASLATAAGFLAFVPTKFVGVAQLGLIAGIGMLIAFACTMTLLPALLTLLKAHTAYAEIGFSRLLMMDRFLRRRRFLILSAFGALAILGICLIPTMHFDADPLHTKNPDTEGMRTLQMLADIPHASPYTGEVIVKNFEAAKQEVAAFERLSSVASVMWLGMYLPENQREKLAMISDTASLILPGLIDQPVMPGPSPAELRASAARAAKRLAPGIAHRAANDPLREIYRALSVLANVSDEKILATDKALTRFLPEQLQQIGVMLRPTPVTLQSIPPEISRSYALPDGRQLLQIEPKGQINSTREIFSFFRQMQSVNPDLGGTVAEVVESARTMIHAFIVAALSAIVAIALILCLIIRRLLDVALVIAPLVLSALLTVILIVSVPETLNYANIIALPLLLGVGVSFNIYFVMNWRDGLKNPLASPTARAVLFSALTTGTAFGSLAASQHPGTASMGRLLLMSLACTLVASFIFIPALLPKRSQDEE